VSKSSDFKSLFENLMRKAIDLSPDFSVSYWIFGTFYSINGEKELARNYLEQAFKINPLLKDFSFKRNSIEFMKNFKKDPFIFDFRKFVNFIKRDYVPGAHFMKYNFHLSVGYLNKKSPEEAIARHMEFYYFSPLLARSIFLRTASYLKNREQPGLANKIIKKTQQLITQNSLHMLP
jgi:tetratricopeptide (TPR) repeat protein